MVHRGASLDDKTAQKIPKRMIGRILTLNEARRCSTSWLTRSADHNQRDREVAERQDDAECNRHRDEDAVGHVASMTICGLDRPPFALARPLVRLCMRRGMDTGQGGDFGLISELKIRAWACRRARSSPIHTRSGG